MVISQSHHQEYGSVIRQHLTTSDKKKKMVAAFSYSACTKLSLLCPPMATQIRPRTTQKVFVVTNPEQDSTLEEQETETIKEEQQSPEKKIKKQPTPLRPVEKQLNVRSKGMTREFGGQWLSSVTRHVRIYAAYIDPETCEFDQTQMDKLTLILDPTEEFVWEDESCNKVYSYFQELVDHYEVIIFNLCFLLLILIQDPFFFFFLGGSLVKQNSITY